MFTGLIEEVGTVVAMARVMVRSIANCAPRTRKGKKRREHSREWLCLTLTSRRGDRLTFDLLEETIARTNLNRLRQNSQINLEALARGRAPRRHFIQGHIDCVSPIVAFGKSAQISIGNRIAARVRALCRFKRSIAINGISLTVSEVLPKSFAVWIIPYTKRHTNLDRAEPATW